MCNLFFALTKRTFSCPLSLCSCIYIYYYLILYACMKSIMNIRNWNYLLIRIKYFIIAIVAAIRLYREVGVCALLEGGNRIGKDKLNPGEINSNMMSLWNCYDVTGGDRESINYLLIQSFVRLSYFLHVITSYLLFLFHKALQYIDLFPKVHESVEISRVLWR